MRLDKFVCKSTELIKRDVIQYIHLGAVRVNHSVITNEATQVHENNTIMLNGVRLQPRAFRYILMHKAAGTICSNKDEAYPSLFNDLNVGRVSELHIAGRLDADTTGLVLITDDGRWSFNITQPAQKCEKVYRVQLARKLSADVPTTFARGILLQGEATLTLPAQVTVIHAKEVLLTITEGRFHQVKRMFAAVGNRVVSLHREQIGDVSLDVDIGQWRYLTRAEVDSFGHAFEPS
ncbi:pseudouridine synthase [Marinomonas algicola]|uniref:pseudouridine synthase n=1 Tax=Marinomonas algicola TaxID=2773454 RepID=UPI00174C2887|nr:pseudouridine synthase [Marinomonas algicola]